jgi:hypothetical protein
MCEIGCGQREPGGALRKELAVIYYNYGINQENGRKVEVAIPKVTVKGERLRWTRLVCLVPWIEGLILCLSVRRG